MPIVPGEVEGRARRGRGPLDFARGERI